MFPFPLPGQISLLPAFFFLFFTHHREGPGQFRLPEYARYFRSYGLREIEGNAGSPPNEREK